MSTETLVLSVSTSQPRDGHVMTRTRPLHTSKSFSRLESVSSSPLTRSRASTLQSVRTPAAMSPERYFDSPSSEPDALNGDMFIQSNDEDGTDTGEPASSHHDTSYFPRRVPEDFDTLPIELISLTDRFIESLSAKVHPTPPSISRLSDLFQDFYAIAALHIQTHISTLSSRMNRGISPTPSRSSSGSFSIKVSKNPSSAKSSELPATSLPGKTSEMLTAEEITLKKRARKLLERKRIALEEAVEKRACEGVYDSIWRHRSTQDEARDDKLRSRTAALLVVGIRLKDLGIDVDMHQTGDTDSSQKDEEVRERLTEARQGLIRMNDEKYPLGKLLHLKAAHKSVVDTLSHFHPSSSSADEILPTLIYALITTPTEGINVISNLHFIQRFRASAKIDGEAAYCLTNLEAAITFLETVDLASLKIDELPQGTPKNTSTTCTPIPESQSLSKDLSLQTQRPFATEPTIPPQIPTTPSMGKIPTIANPGAPGASSHHRRLSSLLQQPTNAFGVASDAVITSADQGIKNISTTLENSYKFLFGKLKEHNINENGLDGTIEVPKTLDDARRLVGTPPLVEDDDGTVSVASSVTPVPTDLLPDNTTGRADEKLLAIFAGRHQQRERSVDSIRSSSSGSKRVSFQEGIEDASPPTKDRAPIPLASSAPAPSTSSSTVDAMRNIGNSLNPLNRLAGMNVMRGFGRSNASSTVQYEKQQDVASKTTNEAPQVSLKDNPKAIPIPAVNVIHKAVPKTSPPIQRFLELENPGDMKISEVLELLRDYRRLASHLKDIGGI